MKRFKKKSYRIATIGILILSALSLYQNCGDVRVKGLNEEPTKVVEPTPPPPPPEEPTPTPSPGPPIVTDDGIPNPNISIVDNSHFEIGLMTQIIFINGYWVAIGAAQTRGPGGIWTMKEDSSRNTCGRAACEIDFCALTKQYARGNNYVEPGCPTAGSGASGIPLNFNSLIKMSDTDFLLLAYRPIVPLADPIECGAYEGSVYRLRLMGGQSLQIVDVVPGCINQMFLNQDKLIVSGRLTSSESVSSYHIFDLNDLNYVRTLADQASDTMCFSQNSLVSRRVSNGLVSYKIGKLASSGNNFEYSEFNPGANDIYCSYGGYFAPKSFATVSSPAAATRTVNLYTESAPGVVSIEKTITLLRDPASTGKGPFVFNALSGEKILTLGFYIQVGNRPPVAIYMPTNISGSGYSQVHVSPNGYILGADLYTFFIRRLVLP